MNRLLLIVAVTAGFLGAAWFWQRELRPPQPSYAPLKDSRSLNLARALRPNYPYSVIPGGAYSPAELRAAAARDPLVRTHYVGFDLENARLVKLTESRSEYVSFRKDGKIFWTGRPLRIPAGEILLTDGHHLAKTRCGNRLSEVAMRPTASREVSNAVLAPPLLDAVLLPRLQFVQAPMTGPVLPTLPDAMFELASLTPTPASPSGGSGPLASAAAPGSGPFAEAGGGSPGLGGGGFESLGGSGGDFGPPGAGVGYAGTRQGGANGGSQGGVSNTGGNGGGGIGGSGGSGGTGGSGNLPSPSPKPVSVVPEPDGQLLMVGGLFALGIARARRQRPSPALVSDQSR